MVRYFKISFYINSHVERSKKQVDKFITVSVVVRRDNRHEIVVKENDNAGWSCDGMML
jgi:hypothetical protein